MRKQFCLFLFLCLCSLASAQKKPAERFPEFIYISEAEGAAAKSNTNLFQKYYNLKAPDALRPASSETDLLGLTQEKFQQYYKELIVDGATSTVHSKEGKATLLTGNFTPVENLSTVPKVSSRAAFEAAVAHVGAKRYKWEEPKSALSDYEKPAGELVVVVDFEGNNPAKLAYKFDIYAVDPLYRAYVFIDAQSGKYLKENLLLHDANVPATGTSLYHGTVAFTAESFGGSFRLRESGSSKSVETYNWNGGSPIDITSPSTFFTSDAAGVEAHWSAEKTHDFYKQLGRNSYDNAGATMKSYVHYLTNLVNAYWTGSEMLYGDGNGSTITPLTTLDICGHEITHAVTQFSANLTYAYEPGALNESFSDIMGEAVENYAATPNNWLLGSEIGITIRSMSNPNAFGQPDTYLGTNWYTGGGDNGGVHTNSGVQNFWFYLLSVGGNGTNDLNNVYCVKPIGIKSAARIAYRNLTVYLSSSSNYAAARVGAIQAARDLFGVGSVQEIATTNAWYAVGVGAAYIIPASIACPPSMTVSNAPGLCSAPVVYPTPVGKATCPTTIQTTGLFSGASFPVGATVNTFKVTDAINNATASCSFTIQVNDVEKPAISCPPNLALSCDASTDPSMTGNPTTSDNCAVGTVTHTDVKVPGTCSGNFTINRTWNVVDNHTNTNSCVQIIKLQDVTAPAVTCPADITVACDTTPAKTGIATVTDNCDPSPKTAHSDVVTAGDCDWLCTIERTWVGKDDCGNSKKCLQIITRSTLPLIEQALNKDVNGDGSPDLLVMGFTNSTVTLPPGTGNCILKYLPYSPGMPPSGLKFGTPVVGANCLPGTNPVDASLRLKNPLLGKALKLAIIVRLQPNVGTTLLSTLNCTIHPVILQALKPNPDINELLRVTNLTLGNINFGTAAHKQFLLDALKCVNAPLKICK